MRHIKSSFRKNFIWPALLITALFCLGACSTMSSQSSGEATNIADSAVAPPPPGDIESFAAYNEGVPGGVIAKTMEINARITAIDHFNREATLMGSDGNEVTVKVGPEAVNFDKIQKV